MFLKALKIFFIPLGLLKKLVELAKDGARDIYNCKRFPASIVDAGCRICEESSIADHTHILSNSIITRSEIGEYSYVGKSCTIQNTEIGKFCSFASGLFMGTGTHPIDLFSTSTLFYRVENTFGISVVKQDMDFEEYQKIEVGNDVWIGTRAMIMDGVKIGHGAIVAANAVVTKDVPPYAIVGGVPARIIKYRFGEDRIKELMDSEWWDWPLEEINEKMDSWER